MNIRLLLCILFIFIFKIENHAQINLEPSTYVQKAKVGLVDEFIKRFNGMESHPNVSSTDSTYRRDNLLYLFNASCSIGRKDSVLKEIISFIDVVSQNSTILNYSDTDWFGIANCKGLLYGKPVTFDLYLSVECRDDDMYKWVIAKANGSCFDIAPKDSSKKIILSPDSHETKFISLRRMTREQPFNVALFMTDGFEYDQTSAFAYLVKTNQLKIDYVDNLEFVFTQVPGYLFHIKYFERESGNAGWLINKFYKINDNEKKDLLKSLHIKYGIKDEFINTKEITYSDSCNMSSMQEVICKRVVEKMQLACDYLNYFQTLYKRDTRKYYVNKFRKLFINGAKVYLNDINSSSKTTTTIEAFCDKVLNNNFKGLYKIDSIRVPNWKGIDEMKDVSQIETAMLYPDGLLSQIEETLNVPLIVEQTEDGTEFMIYLGDLFISKED